MNEIKITEEMIVKESFKLILQSNSFIIPFFSGFGLSFILYALEYTTYFYFALILSVLGIGTLLFNLIFNKEKFKTIYLEAYNKKIEQSNKEQKQKLLVTLKNEEAKIQVETLERKFKMFQEKLNEEITSKTYAYHRILGSVEELQQSIINNLELIVEYEKNKEMLDIDYIRKSMSVIDEKRNRTIYDNENYKSFKNSLEKFRQFDLKIAEIVSNNNIAIATLDDIKFSLTGNKHNDNIMVINSTVSDIQRISKIVEKRKEIFVE